MNWNNDTLYWSGYSYDNDYWHTASACTLKLTIVEQWTMHYYVF